MTRSTARACSPVRSSRLTRTHLEYSRTTKKPSAPRAIALMTKTIQKASHSFAQADGLGGGGGAAGGAAGRKRPEVTLHRSSGHVVLLLASRLRASRLLALLLLALSLVALRRRASAAASAASRAAAASESRGSWAKKRSACARVRHAQNMDAR